MEMHTYKLAELAELVDGEVQGDPETVIHGLRDIESAGQGEITFIIKATQADQIASSLASAVIVPQKIPEVDRAVIRVRDPNLAAAVIHNLFLKKPFTATGISPKAHIGGDCRIPAEVSIGPQAVLGERVLLGNRITIGPGVVIADNVEIGDDSTIYANVTIGAGSRIGARVIIHSGTVIGSDGFGYATDKNGRHLKRPHVGFVQIDDDVEIGANVCIDRGTFGKTLIGRGTKIDNLVQIGHNVEIGENSILVAQVGIAGSTTVGAGVILGGQVGIAGHVTLDDHVMVGAKSGVHSNIERGKIVSGYPAIDHKSWLKACSFFPKLPQMVKEIRELRKKVESLSGQSNPFIQEGKNE